MWHIIWMQLLRNLARRAVVESTRFLVGGIRLSVSEGGIGMNDWKDGTAEIPGWALDWGLVHQSEQEGQQSRWAYQLKHQVLDQDHTTVPQHPLHITPTPT
jgi:hypothetical protein